MIVRFRGPLMQCATMLGLAVIVSSSADAAPGRQWQTYGNARFEYTICYPADLMRPQPEAENGDGRVFLSSDGARMQVWGTYNTRELTPGQVLKEEVARITREGGRVTYTASKKGWYALSGTQDGRIFYQRGTSNSVRFASFRLTYPRTATAKWNPLVAYISSCLDGDPQ